jgi:hypothetical protein
MGIFGGFGQVVGGALQGFGGALKEQGQQEREAALRMLEQGNAETLRERGMGVEAGYRSQEGAAQHGYRVDENTAKETLDHTDKLSEIDATGKWQVKAAREREGSENNRVGNYMSDEDNQIIGFDGHGRVVKTGVSAGGLNKKDRDLISQLEPQFSEKIQTEDDDGNKSTKVKLDARGMADRLTQIGRPDLAKIYGGGLPSNSLPQNGTNNFDSPSYDGRAAAAPTPAAGGGARPQLPKGMTPDAAISQARSAIKAGKDRTAVIQRLQSYGIDTSGL